MKINIEAASYFNKYLDDLNFDIEAEENSTVQDVIKIIGLDEKYIGFVVVNNCKVEFDHKLKNNDKLVIFPFILGG